jgi:hypothetical protein
MQKKGILLAAILFIFLSGTFVVFNLLLSPSAIAAGEGCCANPGTIIQNNLPLQFYCGQPLPSDTCCPADAAQNPSGGYKASDPFFPSSQANCVSQFYSSGDCTTLPKCDVGCCYDPNSAELCSQKTEYICRQNPSTEWQSGDCSPSFNSCPSTGAGSGGNTSTNQTQDVCSPYDSNQAGCTAASGCFWCPLSSKCFSQCVGSCPGYSTDINNNSVCDQDSANYPPCSQSTIICQSPVSAACLCGSTVASSAEYCCALKSLSSSDSAGCSQDCSLRCNENQLVSVTAFQYNGYGYTSCLCGTTVASFSAAGGKYCCFANSVFTLSDTECNPQTTLKGHVYDNTTRNNPRPFSGATISAGGKSTRSDSQGYYEIRGLPAGPALTIIAYNDSFADQELTAYLAAGEQTIDFYLNPFVSSCDNPKLLPSVNFAKQCSDTAKAINLAWENPCKAKGTYIMFQLYRNGNELLATFDGSKDSYTFLDTTFKWASKANYTLYTTYDTMFGSGLLNSSLGLFTGYEQCIGKGDKQVCISNQVVKCNDLCENRTLMTCLAKDKEVCVGPDTNGLAWCVPEQECLNLGNPFGSFYQYDTCQYTGDNLNPCYFDFSSTIIDKCNKCSAARKCSDFRSQGACEDNLCSLTGRCQYLPTNPELGKGICYRVDDRSSDSCERCNELLMGCSPQDCRQLGNCVMKGGSCGSCSQITACRDYEDQASCTGGSPFQITTNSSCGAVFASSYSNDSCGLGYCSWVGNSCIMDLNGDGADDRGIIMPPVTNVTLPKKLLKIGDVISFNVKIVKNGVARVTATPKTFYCITNQTSCCPDTQVYGGRPAPGNYYTGANFVLSKLNNSNVGQGLYKLFFYSTYEEIPEMKEAVKMVTLYADMRPPRITWFNYTLSASTPFYNTDLNISFRTDESAACTASLLGADRNPVAPLSSKRPKEYFVRYLNLTDGKYQYIISCRDNADNLNETIFQIEINRVNLIISVSPDLETIKLARPIVARTELGSSIRCYSYPLGSVLVKPEMTKTQMGSYLMFTSKEEDKPTGRGSLIYKVECINSENGVIDFANSIFTIDDVPPFSMVNLTMPGAQSLEINSSLWYSNESIFTISCVDPQIGRGTNYPPVFGCNGTRFCFIDDLTKDCTPASSIYESGVMISRLQRAKKYCYQSRDNGGNLEMPFDCTIIKIDAWPPQKPTITAPRYGERNRINASFSTVDDGIIKGDKVGSGATGYSTAQMPQSRIGWKATSLTTAHSTYWSDPSP